MRLGRVAAVIGVLALAGAGAVVWRVRQGPVRLDFLIPRITAALAPEDGWAVGMDGLALAWRASKPGVELRAEGLRVARPGEGASVALPAARIRLHRRALLRGRVRVRAIELDAPALTFVRDARGRLGLQGEAAAGAAADDEGLGWLGSLLKRLERVAVRDGRVRVIDEVSGTTWTVPRLDGEVWRTDGLLRMNAELTLGEGDAALPFRLDAQHRLADARLTLQLSAPGVDTAAAFAAWAPSLAPQARAWVTTHVTGGRVGPTVLAFAGRLVREDDWKVAIEDLDASVRFTGLAVRWLDGMPPVGAVAGMARFARDGVDVEVERGTLEGLAVGPARVRVAWPPGAPADIAIAARARGTLAHLVAVLDHRPIALGERVRVRTDGLAGTADARVRLAFPLDGRVRFGRLGLVATATVAGAAVPGLAGDWDVAGADASVVVSERAVRIDGTGTMRGVPATFRVRDRLDRPHARRIDLTARVDDAARGALGLDTSGSITGPVDARLRVASRPDGRLRASLDADLAPADVAIPLLAMRKPAGEPGRAGARIALARGVPVAVERFDVTAGAVAVRGTAARPATGGPWSRVDAEVSFALPDRPYDPGVLTVALTAEHDRWRTAVATRDVGLVLRAYGWDGVRGGRTTLDGHVTPGDGGAGFDGELVVERATLARVPWLVKVVSLASVRGLLQLGSDQPIEVERAVATLAYRAPGPLAIRDAVARGPQLALKLAGTVDPPSAAVDLEGTMIPSYYFLNEGAGRIPFVGGMLGMAGALQGVTFTVRGPRNDPAVAVRPLSSLAPGVLRDWLGELGL